MSGWLFLHILALGVWIGCIATETVIEHSVRDEAQRDYVAEAHWPIDLFVEVPAFLLAGLSGVVLLSTAPSSGATRAMAIAGLLAILCNAACVWVVWARRAARRRGDLPAFERLDHIQHKLGGALVLLILVALGAGLLRIIG